MTDPVADTVRWRINNALEMVEKHGGLRWVESELLSALYLLEMSEVRMRPQEIRGFRTEDMALAPAPKPKQKFRLVWDD